MKAFGIELRKANGLGNLYRDVDATLDRIQPKEMERGAVAHSLMHMFSNTHFSVCTIRDCAEMCAIIIPVDRYKIYQSVHCVNWNAMEPDFREKLCAMVLNEFRGVLTPEEVTETEELIKV